MVVLCLISLFFSVSLPFCVCVFRRSCEHSTRFAYHGQGHAIDLVLVFGLVLAEGRMAFEQFVEHTAEAEPVGARIVSRSFRKYFGGHVAMCATVYSRHENNNNKNKISYKINS